MRGQPLGLTTYSSSNCRKSAQGYNSKVPPVILETLLPFRAFLLFDRPPMVKEELNISKRGDLQSSP